MYNVIFVLTAVVSLFLASGCANLVDMDINIINRQTLRDVPSASGLELIGKDIYTVGDNAPWLFKLNEDFEIVDKLAISSMNYVEEGIIPKSEKPDFEAMTSVIWKGHVVLLIFGSGSKSPQRDTLVCIQPDRPEEAQTYSLTALYEGIKKKGSLQANELNIEAAATGNDAIYLMNRGRNLVIQYPLRALMQYLSAEGEMPEPTLYPVKLPVVNGIEAGFSGAAMIAGDREMLFTASVENTANWIDDGEVLGSFVGILDMESLKGQQNARYAPIMDGEKAMGIKVESIAVVNPDIVSDELDILLVTDSDGAASEILQVKLRR